ncbi:MULTISPECIES: DUF6191 domain-containing protein [unclassified Streptomyces]|uniref:DUF6191 domain-containing protein n=1 Tax=unclassified Streptomyces TaxID=2593676 RepID=UPI002E8067DB|nr:DUF6191 domain-containing protein [Streptomyces sp. NBC_00589]WTI36082.1 DUF6191 domain-containing protein [Streptomyces sp. NBC_00775]WUB30244.1 DUF6191 domain-containing protein [Streptomyces sp. NBC_00589]
MFNMFEELFAPGRKHTNDERKRLELTRVDLNDADPGRGPIDLSSGKVVVRLPKPEPGQERAGTAEEPKSEREPKSGREPKSAREPKSGPDAS